MPDPILLWNEVALEANRISHTNGKNEETGPTRSSRALAIVHLAMYDALAGFRKDLPPFLTNAAPKKGATENAAIAGAAYHALSSLYPSQENYFKTAMIAGCDPSDSGFTFGKMAAAAILEDRCQDQNNDANGYRPKDDRCKHRVDPQNADQGFLGPFYGAKTKGFSIRKRFTLAAPPSCSDKEYIQALREVRGLGIAPELMGTLPPELVARTPDQTLAGIWWAYDGAFNIGTPPRLYNQIVRVIAEKKSNDVVKNARLFAFVNVAMADAGILAWEQKYSHELWRPVLGVREHDESMGPSPQMRQGDFSKDCDPDWLPLGAPKSNTLLKNFTPHFPAYPSGHATFGAAALHITRLFYGIEIGDRDYDALGKDALFVSDEFDGESTDNKGTVRPRHTRKFPGGLWEMIEENARSRVYLGVHWIFDSFAVKDDGSPDWDKGKDDSAGIAGVGGVPLGLAIAEDIFSAGGGVAPKRSTTADPSQ